MSSQKEIILNYCKTVKTHDIDHLQNAIENARYIETGEYRMMNGCPSAYGLDDHIGICEIEETDDYTEQQKVDMCNRCWKQALVISGMTKEESGVYRQVINEHFKPTGNNLFEKESDTRCLELLRKLYKATSKLDSDYCNLLHTEDFSQGMSGEEYEEINDLLIEVGEFLGEED